MALPQKVNSSMPRGIVGEFSDNSPKSVRAYMTLNKPKFGALCSLVENGVAGTSDTVVAAQKGGIAAGKKVGILVGPKEHYQVGFVSGQKTLAADEVASIAFRGHIWVPGVAGATAGGAVYVDADGNLKATAAEGDLVLKGACWLKKAENVKLGKDSAGKLPGQSGYVETKDYTDAVAEIEIDNPTVEAQPAGE